jgi:hypothetical protein
MGIEPENFRFVLWSLNDYYFNIFVGSWILAVLVTSSKQLVASIFTLKTNQVRTCFEALSKLIIFLVQVLRT